MLLSAISLVGFGFSDRNFNEVILTQESNSTNTETRNFILKNASVKSIPLIIPNVMNPNLSPFSESRVELALGQEILFRENKKKYVLLKVDDQIKNGDVIEVAALLKKRKKELGL